MNGYTKGGESAKVNGYWFRVDCTPSGTYGKVFRTETETWGRPGDSWNPPRSVTVEKCVATTRKFPAYHTSKASEAAQQLRDHYAGTAPLGPTLLQWLTGVI